MSVESDDRERHDPPAAPECATAPIVGIGASAGGIDALKKFFSTVAPDIGQTFVVVQHLAPDHKSMLAELLARCSRLPVTLVKDATTAVAPNRVYVIPPNAVLTIEAGRLHLSRPAADRAHRMPIDSFFASLAEDQGENAACVILSGTGSDGTLGLRAIKEHGGLTLAQTSDSAQYDGMMRSAIGTGLVDFVLPAEDIPAKLAEYFRHLAEIAPKKESGSLEQEAADHLSQLYALMAARTGHNFGGYKNKTVIRRMQRRMQLLQIDRVSAFIERLRREPRELDLLFQDMLIGVTSFFRDAPAFDALKLQVIPHLFEGKGSDDTVRVWVPGCSTGEEAYSIAILLRELVPKANGTPKLQVFATDINEHALDIARTGRYPASIAEDVSPHRLERFFLREDGTYRINSDLREMCLFSAHNLLRDPPFARQDLISCRNLMIYFNGELQNRVIPLFHYALRPNGYLFLGTSENVTRHPRLFATVDKAFRIFKRLPQADRKPISFPLSPNEPARRPPAADAPAASPARSLMGLAERQILDRYAPAFVVIDAEGELLQSSGRTGKYLELPTGAPDTNVFSLARTGLRLELRAAVRKSIISGQVAIQNNVTVGTNGGRQTLRLIVQPLRTDPAGDALYMVVFQDTGTLALEPESAEATETGLDTDGTARQLEAELRATRERLQTITEELESSNEELKSANEELSSMNEELQSSNEELETSKEELQSTNEELHTVNGELNTRVEELSRANNDMSNLLENTQIATIFLDRDLNVKSYTPTAKDVFRLVESDAGRPISHVRNRFALDTLQEDIEKVLRTLGTIERYVRSTETKALYILRILPYRTVDNVIGGVVLTFTDITRITAAESRVDELTRDLRNRLESLETLLDLLPVGIAISENGGTEEIRVNKFAARALDVPDGGSGLTPLSTAIRLFADDRELPPEEQPLQRAARSGENVPGIEGRLARADGSTLDVLLSAAPLFDNDGKSRGAIEAIVDISHRKRADRLRALLMDELNHRVKNTLATVQSIAMQSLKGVADPDIRKSFSARLIALSRTHDLVARDSWEGVPLSILLHQELGPYRDEGGTRIEIGGPELKLRPKAALALSLAFHELATNAAKYGALSKVSGQVRVTWDVLASSEPAVLRLAWTETGGPPVAPPKRKGFGTTLLERGLSLELDGNIQLEFNPSGFACTIEIPLSVAGEGRQSSEVIDVA
jgi:two-component system, chemotaxis family, CheB/CheR fusion protein